MRSVFGWSYPAGAENDPNAPYNQDGDICEVCERPADVCICPQCPECGAFGDPKCAINDGPGCQLEQEEE